MKEKEKQRKPAGLICAAGRSSRMGACKPLLPLGDETVLRKGVITMKKAGVSPIVVVAGREAEAVSESVKDLGAEVIFNREYAATQMFDSVKMGLCALQGRCDCVLFTPADIPLYTAETVRLLLNAGERICAPVFEGRTGHPVCFDADLIEEILAYEGAGGLAGAFESLGGKSLIECSDEGILIEADTPEEYERMKEYYACHLSGPAR